MNYPFVQNDGGRSGSRRPKQINDCTVRALSIITGKPYDEVYDELAEEGRKCGKGFHIKNWLRRNGMTSQKVSGQAMGHTVSKIYFPAVKGQRRMNPVTFAKEFSKGKYLVRTAKHVAAWIDGTLNDISPEDDDRCIYVAYKFVKNPTDKEIEMLNEGRDALADSGFPD